jgi:hypothetical protein
MPDPNIFLSKLEKVRQNVPERWMARCPAHDDRTPSLSIGVSKQDGRVLFQCFAGCAPLDILGAVGLTLDDLQDGPIAKRLLGGNDHIKRQKVADKLGIERLVLAMAEGDRSKGKKLSPEDLKREREAYLFIKKHGGQS